MKLPEMPKMPEMPENRTEDPPAEAPAEEPAEDTRHTINDFLRQHSISFAEIRQQVIDQLAKHKYSR